MFITTICVSINCETLPKSYTKEKDDYWHLKNLRNAILHGTKTTDTKVEKAIDSLKDFENIFDEGINLFNKILANEV